MTISLLKEFKKKSNRFLDFIKTTKIIKKENNINPLNMSLKIDRYIL
jgi:hypothetical protein